MKLILMLILLIPILIFQSFILSDSLALFMKTRKGTPRTNNIYLRNEKSPRKASFKVIGK